MVGDLPSLSNETTRDYTWNVPSIETSCSDLRMCVLTPTIVPIMLSVLGLKGKVPWII